MNTLVGRECSVTNRWQYWVFWHEYFGREGVFCHKQMAVLGVLA